MNGLNVLRAGALAGMLALALGAGGGAASAQDARQAAGAGAGATPDPDHRQGDIGRHRAMAAAHETAARCLERGEKESVCHEALRKACQGLAVGRYCGMKHSH